MAKSQNRQIDKLERKARLAGIHRQHEIEQHEMRNLHRMGWQGFDQEDDCDDDLDEQRH